MEKTRRKKQSRGEHTRVDLLRAATEIISERGFEGVSVRVVAERAGSSVGSFYHHFKNKNDLIAAVVDDAHVALRRFLREVRYLPSSVSLEERNVRAVTEFMNFAEKHRVIFSLLTGETERMPPELRRLAMEERRLYHEEQTRDLQDHIDRGWLPPFDVRLASRAILAAVTAILNEYAHDPGLERDAVIDAMARSVVGILRAMSGSDHSAYIDPRKKTGKPSG